MEINEQRLLEELKKDAERIEMIIQTQSHSCLTECKAFEEVVDTQMYGFSREVDLAIRSGLVKRNEAQSLLEQLEIQVNQLYDCFYEEDES